MMIIIMLSMAGTFLFFEEQAYILSLLALLLLIGAVINIIRYFNNINQWISLFLLGIENEDTTLKTPSKTGNKAIDDVFIGIERLNNLFKQTKIDIITQEQYFRSVINQSATGLFSINEKGRVINSNPAAVKLTNLQAYHHINSLTKIDAVLPDFIMRTNKKIDQQSTIFENHHGQKLLFKLSEIKTRKEIIILVAVSDITKELDNGEVDAWIKLARTLSHEIMNNITPITTLSQVISSYFTKDNRALDIKNIDSKIIDNTIKGLQVIEERSQGLISFVNNYRKFTKLPVPNFKVVNLFQLIENNLIAANTFCGFDTIELEKSIPEDIMFTTDEKLLSQVIINLLKNACEALIQNKTEKPKLKIKVLKINNSARVEITNNGPLIPSEDREQIFVPFYTSKENGSGVGLSLSKQIMLKMNGDVLLYSTEDKLTTFTVVLN
ncbi:MAG: GHKL domain-containing protein [Bacteroidetes bacterium]|nr:GHKL domain-containing protein [Bacteroidota bacterium]